VLPARPRAQRRWLIAGEGGTVELRCEALTTASPQCPFRARYELRGVTTELTKQRKEDEGVPVAVGRGELRSGEVRRRRKPKMRPLPWFAGTTARWKSSRRLRWSFGWFVPSGDTTTMMRELGVAAVAMASPSAHLGLHGEEEGKWNGGGGELGASWHT